jgi:hypothetical protein
MRIFTDLHHGDLYYSLHLLLERRLGHELYRPIGLDWFHSGYWKIAAPYGNAIGTVNQYLQIRPGMYDQYKNLNGQHYVEDSVYHVWHPGHKYYQRAITFDQFQKMEFDVVMPTHPDHGGPFTELRNRFQPKAKLIQQMGNAGQRTSLPNVLHSSPFPNPRADQHCLRYHQEINPDLFSYSDPNPDTRNVYSVVNCAPYLGKYNQYKALIGDANWKYYGASSPDGALSGGHGVAGKMHEANVAWHLKPKGGVGHSTKGWFAVGRPLVTNMSEHRKAGGDTLLLFRPGVTCIDLDSGTVHENERQIRNVLEPEENLKWSRRVRKIFDEVVNFDRQEGQVKEFLENLR